MNNNKVTDTIFYIGVDDKTIDLFESQYVVPNGISYNSYVIMDDKVTVMDTVDARKTEAWMSNLEAVLGEREVDYLIVSHVEPDHAASVKILAEKYPQMKLVGNAKTFVFLSQFFATDFTDRAVIVKEGDTLELGSHTLQFVMAPMIHWPEVMMSYELSEKIMFSADAFGKFGALDTDEDWACEARRYYFNIVGKYGNQVQAVLKKLATLDVAVICPLHGPILREKLSYYIEKYNIWSSYEPEDEGVLIAYASIHGNTAKAAKKMAEILREHGTKKVVISDLAREDMAEVIEDAFRYDKMILASATYDSGLFPCMEDFLAHLKSKGFQKRTIGLMENGTWAPQAAKHMKNILETMKNLTICEQTVSIKSAYTDKNVQEMQTLAEQILG
ncbi:MAG: FprA family A-type flavoprotein [Lachnospiraceae bacterium]|nr:FprA family A-type flavoprotein [Lachnospiraceae bacterium]